VPFLARSFLPGRITKRGGFASPLDLSASGNDRAAATRLWQRQGRRDEARAALAAVYGTFTEDFTTPDLVDAAALLHGLA
jgi:hypothetical protein